MSQELRDRKKTRRVAFIAHALLPGYLSSESITQCLRGVWPQKGTAPGFIRWLSFPVLKPPGISNEGVESVWVDFYIIPAFAPEFQSALKSNVAYGWVERVALYAIEEARIDAVPLWVGWGALTKNATRHGSLFLHHHPEIFSQSVFTTHGDAGTTALALSALKKAGVGRQDNVAIIGANGAIGAALARSLPLKIAPTTLILIGKPDRPGAEERLEKLRALKREVEEIAQGKTCVVTHQDKSQACLVHRANVVIITTIGMQFHPQEVPEGALVIDITTPSACSQENDWSRHKVILAGCGQFADWSLLPLGFCDLLKRHNKNIGAAVGRVGGEGVIWGCTGETIAQAMFDCRAHDSGQAIGVWNINRAESWFSQIGFAPQPPVTFGKETTWEETRKFLKR